VAGTVTGPGTTRPEDELDPDELDEDTLDLGEPDEDWDDLPFVEWS